MEQIIAVKDTIVFQLFKTNVLGLLLGFPENFKIVYILVIKGLENL